MYRNRALLDYARHCSCQNCGADNGTIVAAHSNQLAHGKGMGIKAHDCFIAYLCINCHDIVDGRALPTASQRLRESIWTKAHHKTLQLLINQQMLSPEAMELLHQSGSI